MAVTLIFQVIDNKSRVLFGLNEFSLDSYLYFH